MSHLNDSIAVVRKAVADLGIAPFARKAAVSQDTVRRLLQKATGSIESLGKMETVAMEHAAIQRAKYGETA